jgi:hypothetical protein
MWWMSWHVTGGQVGEGKRGIFHCGQEKEVVVSRSNQSRFIQFSRLKRER